MIVATAGHVDHGKTLLTKALTGIDTDRLPEEKRRGMTIDLGFAYLPIGNGRSIGFIDVPGHERFVRNMLCGVSGIDAVLFVVAADDGPMPQTFEHLSILDLLGVRIGVVAITKIDKVSPTRATDVQREIAGCLEGTTLDGAPVFPVSATTGFGIEKLRRCLGELARRHQLRSARGNFRLPVDRCFNIPGAGLVVTGTLMSGSVAVGDQVRVLSTGLGARVRSIHAQSAQSDRGRAGERCAINLAGINLRDSQIGRGDWIVGEDAPSAIEKLDGRLHILRGEGQPFRHWTPVHLHLGATDVTGRVALLENPSIPAGESGLIQIALDRAIGALRGDKFIIRDQSARRTIGGGQVIDIFVPLRGRRRPERLAYLTAMEVDNDSLALATLLERAPHGLNLSNFSANRNLAPAESAALLNDLDLICIKTRRGLVSFSRAHWNQLKAATLDVLAARHRAQSQAVTIPEDRVQSDKRIPREATAAIVAELVQAGAIVREGSNIRLASHAVMLDQSNADLWSEVQSRLKQSGRPLNIREIADLVGEDAKKVASLLNRASQTGAVVRVAGDTFLLPDMLLRFGEIVEELARASQSGLVTAAAARDRCGIGRNLTIELLEFFDRLRFTRRIGDGRKVLRPAADAFGSLQKNPTYRFGTTDGKESHPGGAPGLQIR